MILKFLGILDIISGIIFLLSGIIGNFQQNIVLFFGVLILIKGLIFISDLNINSIIDSIIGIMMVLSSHVGWGLFIIIIASLFLIQKGVFSVIEF